jgi:spermidine/putrescine transport system permease protein
VVLERDIFDDTLSFADAHMIVFWRSVRLAGITNFMTLIFGFPPPISSHPAGDAARHLVVPGHDPFWTNFDPDLRHPGADPA